MKLRAVIVAILLCVTLFGPQRAGADDAPADAAIASGLAYLAKQQNADGSFEQDRRRVASTGLSLLAFLATGSTSDGGRYATTVRRATDFLLRQVPANHNLGMRGQAIATLALCQAYGVEPEEQTRAKIRAVTKDAVAIILSAQQDGAWADARAAKALDPVPTQLCVNSLRAAQQINLRVPQEKLDRAAAYLVQHSPTTSPSTQPLIEAQLPDGSWPADASNQPASDIETTAMNVLALARSLQLMPN